MILADTSVWVRHWRHGEPAFAAALRAGKVTVHPFIIGELALGHLEPRAAVLADLASLPGAPQAETDEVMAFIEQHRLWNSGIGWVDCHLLASARLGHHQIWTLDRPLARAAHRLGVAFAA